MKNSKLASRYAKALFDFAQERNQLESVHVSLDTMHAALKENNELLSVLNSPVIAPSKKHIIFANIFQQAIDNITFSFFDVLIRKKREPVLLTICEEFTKLYNEFHKIKVITLTCAQPISDELVEKLKHFLTAGTEYTLELHQVISPEIIGGFTLKMEDFYYDNSILSKINKLRQEFAHNIYKVNF